MPTTYNEGQERDKEINDSELSGNKENEILKPGDNWVKDWQERGRAVLNMNLEWVCDSVILIR
jgi:hypothetical protein